MKRFYAIYVINVSILHSMHTKHSFTSGPIYLTEFHLLPLSLPQSPLVPTSELSVPLYAMLLASVSHCMQSI